MYTFSSKLKTFSFVLMAIGLLGIGYGFLTAPKDIQDVEKILAAESKEGHVAHHELTTPVVHAEVLNKLKLKRLLKKKNMLSMFYTNCKTNLGLHYM